MQEIVFFFFNLDLSRRYRNEIADSNKKYALASAKQFPKKSILRAIVFTETIRQRVSFGHF